MTQENNAYDAAAEEAVELGNRLADADSEADLRDIADGLLAGAVQYWLYAYQPCGDPQCAECAPVATAEARLEEMRRLLDEFARESDYFHSAHDTNVGRA